MSEPDFDIRQRSSNNGFKFTTVLKVGLFVLFVCIAFFVSLQFKSPVTESASPVLISSKNLDMSAEENFDQEQSFSKISFDSRPKYAPELPLNENSLSFLSSVTSYYKPKYTFEGFMLYSTQYMKDSFKKFTRYVNEASKNTSPQMLHSTMSLLDTNYGIINENSTYALPLQSLTYLPYLLSEDPEFSSLDKYLACMEGDECTIDKIPLYSDRTTFSDGKKRDISIKTKMGFVGGENIGVLPENGEQVSLSQFNIGVIGDNVIPLPGVVDVVVVVMSADTPLEHVYNMVQYVDAAYMSRPNHMSNQEQPNNNNIGYVVLLVIPHALKQSLPAVQALFLSAPQIHIIVATEYRGDMVKAVNSIVKNFVSNDLAKAVNRVNHVRESINTLVVESLQLPLMTIDHVNVAMIHSNTPLTIVDVLNRQARETSLSNSTTSTESPQSTASTLFTESTVSTTSESTESTQSHADSSRSTLAPSMSVSVESVLFRLFRHSTSKTPISIIASANATCLAGNLSPAMLPIYVSTEYPHSLVHNEFDPSDPTDASDEPTSFPSDGKHEKYGHMSDEEVSRAKFTTLYKPTTLSKIGVDVASLKPYHPHSPVGYSLSSDTQMICASAVISRMYINITATVARNLKHPHLASTVVSQGHFIPYKLLYLPSAPFLPATLADDIEITMKTEHNLLRKDYLVSASPKVHPFTTWFPMSPASFSAPISFYNSTVSPLVTDMGLLYHIFDVSSISSTSRSLLTVSQDEHEVEGEKDMPDLKFHMPRSGSYVDGGANTMNAAYDGYSASCLVYYEDEFVSFHFVRQDQSSDSISLNYENINHDMLTEEEVYDGKTTSTLNTHTYPSSVSAFLTKAGYPTWQRMISQYNTVNQFRMANTPSYSESFNLVSGYARNVPRTKTKFYTVTGDRTAITSIHAYVHMTNAVRVDAVFTPVVIDRGVCVMPSAYFDQYDTNPAINIHVAHNSFVNGLKLETDDGSVLVAGLRQILYAMDTEHPPKHISPKCSSLSSLADWRREHIASRTTVDEPLDPEAEKYDPKTKKVRRMNKINSPGTVRLAVLVPSRDNRSDDVVKVPLLSMEVMQKQNKQTDHALLRQKIYSQRRADELRHKSKKRNIFKRHDRLKDDFVPNIMYGNDKTSTSAQYSSPASVNGLFHLWTGREKYISRIHELHQLGYNYNGVLDLKFSTNSRRDQSAHRDVLNKNTVTNNFGEEIELVDSQGRFNSLSHLSQSTVTDSILYSESTTRAEMQMSPLGSLVESIKDTLLSIRRYYQHSENALEVGTNSMPFGPTIFHDVPLVEVTVYVAIDLNDKMWDDPTIMHKFRLVTDLLIGDLPINIKFINRVHGYRGAPNWIWGELARTAYDEGNDYFLQINDDLTFHNKHWLLPLIYEYRNRPIPDFGVVGLDTFAISRLFTQMLFSYRYVEVMNGYSFPGYTNWYGDDFVSTMFSHYPKYNMGFITPDVFNNEKGRYDGVDHNLAQVYDLSTKQRFRFYKYLQVYFPDHPDTQEFIDRIKVDKHGPVPFYHTFLHVY